MRLGITSLQVAKQYLIYSKAAREQYLINKIPKVTKCEMNTGMDFVTITSKARELSWISLLLQKKQVNK
jgi:hypothetical protein